MKNCKHYLKLSLILIATSAIMFLIHYLVFGQGVNTAYYSLMNLCFIPINSLVVTIILEKLIDYKAKQERVEKLNMLVGIFFTEIGCKLMHLRDKITFLKNDKKGELDINHLEKDIIRVYNNIAIQ
ncbi:MAG: hypothetical protein RSD36_04605 [Terrisporobacter sp.]